MGLLSISFRVMDSVLSESLLLWWKQLDSCFFLFSVGKLGVICFSFIDLIAGITHGMFWKDFITRGEDGAQ